MNFTVPLTSLRLPPPSATTQAPPSHCRLSHSPTSPSCGLPLCPSSCLRPGRRFHMDGWPHAQGSESLDPLNVWLSAPLHFSSVTCEAESGSSSEMALSPEPHNHPPLSRLPGFTLEPLTPHSLESWPSALWKPPSHGLLFPSQTSRRHISLLLTWSCPLGILGHVCNWHEAGRCPGLLWLLTDGAPCKVRFLYLTIFHWTPYFHLLRDIDTHLWDTEVKPLCLLEILNDFKGHRISFSKPMGFTM